MATFKKQYKVSEYNTHSDGSVTQRLVYVGFDKKTASERLKDSVANAIREIELGNDVHTGEGFEVTEFWTKGEGGCVQTGAIVRTNDGASMQCDIDEKYVEVELYSSKKTAITTSTELYSSNATAATETKNDERTSNVDLNRHHKKGGKRRDETRNG